MFGTYSDDAAVLTESCSSPRENKGETRESVQYERPQTTAGNAVNAAQSARVLDAYRPYLESPRAVAADLGISTAELLALARGDPAAHHFTLHPVRDGNVVWIVRPHRVAEMQRRASLRSGSLP